ncbi:MAG: FAD-dependent oxidoreductase [Candidatus Pacebacteria bacterium]|nr:FAD-dependent oxidoreductase [Candidatus Paceibacterota bacterium]
MYDLIIIGGGSAGVTAGIYASRKKINTLVIAKDFFGQISKTGQVDNWPGDMAISGMNLALKLEKHLKSFPVEIKVGQKVVAVKKWQDNFLAQTEDNKEFETKTIIIATGRNAKTLGIEGEQDFVGKGLSYCSICDAPFFKNKQVGVIGGGNAGFETALDLVKYASKVFIFESSDKILADEVLIEKVKSTGKVEICLQAEILRIEGQGKVEAVVYKDMALNKEVRLVVDGVFVQIGSVPATGFLGKLVDFNEKNEIEVDSATLETSVKGIFAAGDCNNTKWKQAIIAASQGAITALSAYEFLQSPAQGGVGRNGVPPV